MLNERRGAFSIRKTQGASELIARGHKSHTEEGILSRLAPLRQSRHKRIGARSQRRGFGDRTFEANVSEIHHLNIVAVSRQCRATLRHHTSSAVRILKHAI